MLDMSDSEWRPEIVETVATKGEGIDELWAAIEKHRAYQEEKGLLEKRRRRRTEREIKEIAAERYRRRIETEAASALTELTDKVVAREIDPYEAADRLIAS